MIINWKRDCQSNISVLFWATDGLIDEAFPLGVMAVGSGE